MKIDNHDNFVVLEDEQNNLEKFASFLEFQIPNKFKKQNVIINLLEINELSLDDLLSVSSSTITNGVFYLSGGSESPVSGVKTVPTNGGYDAWILEIDASGFLNTEKIEGVNTTISVYPNPSSGEVNFKFADLEEDVEVTFYSVDGKILFSDKIQSNSVLKSYDLKVGNQMILYSVEGERINYSGKILIR